MPDIGPMEVILVLAIALLVLGPSKLPEIGKSLGSSIREFRKAATDVQDSVRLDAQPAQPPVAPVQQPVAPAPAPAAAATPVSQAAQQPVAPAPQGQEPPQSPGPSEPRVGA